MATQFDEADVDGSQRMRRRDVSLSVRGEDRRIVVLARSWARVWGGAAYAEPGQDAVAQLNDLTQQAEQLLETVQSAQLDLDKKLQLLNEADKKHADDLAALETARAELAPHQVALDNLAAALYMGGPADGMHAIFTAASPQSFIDKLAIQKVMTTQMANQSRELPPSQAGGRDQRGGFGRVGG